MFIAALFTIAKLCKQPVFTGGWTENYGIYTQKEGYLATCHNVNGPQGHYAKWSKSDRERQILCDLCYTYMYVSLRCTEWIDDFQRWEG